ncbi:MAG: baseplate J/gp47 family protein [Eubacteriales bacterium]|nr:baseplate J/gp47 family protein [Eubacteriales bacterium]
MYENMSFSKLLESILAKVSDKYDKRQGAIIYDAVAPICAELAQVYLELNRILDEGFADTATRKYLIKRAMERGIYPYAATPAIILAQLDGNINLNGGERFNLENMNYFYTGEKEEEYYKLKCEEVGEKGNIAYGELFPIDSIAGLENATVIKIFTAGTDEEDTEDFRKRYFDSFKSQAFGGNKADYIEKIKELNKLSSILDNGGIGGCKVYRTPNGGGTVDIFIINNTYTQPTNELIRLIQEEIDPIEYTGNGTGIAPIGHFVTIRPVNINEIDIYTEIDLKVGYTIDDVQSYIEEKLDTYIKEIAKNWDKEEGLILRISHIESYLLEITGIVDIRNTKINGLNENFILDEYSIPIRRQIDVN